MSSFLDPSTPPPTAILSAVEHQECPICCDPLYSRQVVCLIKDAGSRVRSCRHLYHQECFADYRSKLCPCCRVEFRGGTEPMPNPVENPELWFKYIDHDNNGELSITELTDGLKAILNVDWRKIESNASNLWQLWDKDQSGSINLEEFSHPTTGVLRYLERVYHGSDSDSVVPDIKTNPEAWFKHWDEDGSLSLDRDELTRALIMTLRLNGDVEGVTRMNEFLLNIWPIFDEDSSGAIEMSEFVSAQNENGNLSNMIIAQLAYMESAE